MAKAQLTEVSNDMSERPVFNLGAGNLDYDSDEALAADLEKSNGKFFDTPANVDLVITASDFHKNKVTGSIYCKGDETWFNVKLTLSGPDEKTVDHWLQVPTTKIKFGTKDTLSVYKKLQQFFFSIGEAVSLNNLSATVQKYFADPAKLIGQKVNVDLGYEGPYAAKVEGADEYVIMVKGSALQEDGVDVRLPDRASARQYAKGKGLETGFIKILKFNTKKVSKAVKASQDGW